MVFDSVVSDLTSLTIQKMPEGGFLVFDGWGLRGYEDGNRRFPFRYASTSIDESLKHIKATLDPKETRK